VARDDPSPRHTRRVAVAAEVARIFAAHRAAGAVHRGSAPICGWRVRVSTVAQIMPEQQLIARPQLAGVAPPGRVRPVAGAVFPGRYRRTSSGRG